MDFGRFRGVDGLLSSLKVYWSSVILESQARNIDVGYPHIFVILSPLPSTHPLTSVSGQRFYYLEPTHIRSPKATR